MSNKRFLTHQKSTFKQVDVGQAVVLDDTYMIEHHQARQLEAITKETMAHAEKTAFEIIESAKQEAQAIRDEAHSQAVQIVEEEGHQQRDTILQQAHEEGYRAGLEQGVHQIAQEMADKIHLSNTILEKAFEAERLILNKYQSQVQDVILSVLKLILKHELVTQPEQIRALIEAAAHQIELTGQAAIAMNPETLNQLKAFSPETLEALSTTKSLTFKADPSCSEEDIYLETVTASYDISPEKQAEIYMKTLGQHLVLPAEEMQSHLLAQQSEILSEPAAPENEESLVQTRPPLPEDAPADD